MITLKDIAASTGLSASTISYVLNGKKKVRQDTYERIMKAVEELGYRPNQVARGLKTRHSYSIGVIVPDISNEFFPEIIKGIDDLARKQGYNIILCNTDNNSDRENEAVGTLMSKDIDGIIFIGTAKSQSVLENKIDIPFVLVDRKVADQYASVISDNCAGGYIATDYLVKCGRKRIAMLCGAVFVQTFFDRVTGYMQALKEHGMSYSEDYLVSCDFTISGGYKGVNKLTDKGVEFDALFAANDHIALGAMRALMEKGKKIPDDVAIVGYDDIAISAVVMPSLTTVKQPKYEMGQRAAELLIERIKDTAKPVEHTVLQPSLIVRESAVAR